VRLRFCHTIYFGAEIAFSRLSRTARTKKRCKVRAGDSSQFRCAQKKFSLNCGTGLRLKRAELCEPCLWVLAVLIQHIRARKLTGLPKSCVIEDEEIGLMRFGPVHLPVACVFLFSVLRLAASDGQLTTPPSTRELTPGAKDTESAKGTDLHPPKDYVLGPDDPISIWVADCPDISTKTFNIDMSGHINLPFVGVVQASGLTARQFESKLSSDLKRYFVRPQVAVSIVEFRSQPVSVIGEVNQPGVHQLRGHKTLVEVL